MTTNKITERYETIKYRMKVEPLLENLIRAIHNRFHIINYNKLKSIMTYKTLANESSHQNYINKRVL